MSRETRKQLENLKYWNVDTDVYGRMSIKTKRGTDLIFIQEWIYDEMVDEHKTLAQARKSFTDWLYKKESLTKEEKGEIYSHIVEFSCDGIFE